MIEKQEKSIEQIIFDEIERNEIINQNHYYDAKLPAIRVAQESGLADEDIEVLFNIKILPKHRNKNANN